MIGNFFTARIARLRQNVFAGEGPCRGGRERRSEAGARRGPAPPQRLQSVIWIVDHGGFPVEFEYPREVRVAYVLGPVFPALALELAVKGTHMVAASLHEVLIDDFV